MSVSNCKIHVSLLLTIFLTSLTGQAKSLACWNSYSRLGSKPVLTAHILKNDKLQSVKVSELAYKAFSVNPSLSMVVAGKPIIKKNNQYKGNREFGLSQGARLILPMELSQKALSTAVINRTMKKKSNGVLILPFNNENKKTKDFTFLPMMCQEII